MSIVTEDTDRWMVSAQASGEVLTTRALVSGLDLRLLGRAEGYGPAELESWLQGLAQAVRDSVSATPPGDPVPPMLREALSGLLFSRAELWNRGQPPCALALVGGADRIGFGWVGEASVEVYLDGARDGSEWVSIRDAQGREARAWCASPHHDVRIELAWTPGPGLDVVRLEAHWTAARSQAAPLDVEASVDWMSPEPSRAIESASFAPRPDPAAMEAPPAALEPDPSRSVEPSGTQPETPSSGVARWLAQHFRWNRPGAADAATDDPAEGSSPGRAEGQGPHDVAPTLRDATHDLPGPSERVPVEEMVQAFAAEISSTLDPSSVNEAVEAERATEFDVAPETPESMTLPPEVPGQIPPTPEADAVTARAIVPTLRPAPESEIAAAPAISFAPAVEVAAVATEAETELEPQPEPEVDSGARRARPRQPDWPEVTSGEAARARVGWKQPALWGAVVLVLFGVGWVVGSFQGQGGPEQVRRPSALVLFLRQIGLAPPRFEVVVTSRPEGAWIAVDGKELSVRAPATLELAPGEHRVELSFPELGSAPYLVRGGKSDRVALDVPMWGSVDVVATETRALVNVALDGQPIGFVPLHLDSVAPGPHELRFSGPGMASWGSTIEVRVGEVREVLAYPLQSPATGLLQVRATQNAEAGTAPLDGARVWVDGVARGVTPLTLELPRGPHSVRVGHQKEEAPIQVIDLPGGNQRFATFEFGLRSDLPTLALKAPATFTIEEPALISGTLGEIAAADVREMWLHIRTPEGRWRRYPMTLMDAQGSVVGAAPFPISLLGEDGQQLFYVSAMTTQGDEIFTEMQTARGAPRPRR